MLRCVIKGLHCTRTYLFAMFDACKNDKIPFFITLHMYHLNTQPTLLHFQCQNLMFENQLTLFLILKTPLLLRAEKLHRPTYLRTMAQLKRPNLNNDLKLSPLCAEHMKDSCQQLHIASNQLVGKFKIPYSYALVFVTQRLTGSHLRHLSCER